MKKLSKAEFKIQFRNFFFVILGTFVLAFGTEIFLAQCSLVTGGMSGIAIIIDKLLPTEESFFELIITIETWAFFILGFIFLGKEFTIKTLLSAITYPIAIYLCSFLIDPEINFLNGFFIIESDYQELLACIFGGALTGAGCAITFLGGGSTGGTDIIALILCKVFKKVKSSTMVFIVDAAVVLIAAFVIKSLELTLLGIVAAFLCALVIDKIFLGPSSAFIAEIVTAKSEEITNAVIKQLERTSSIFDIQGGYSKENKKMLLISFTMEQYSKLMNIISSTDPKAFVLIHRAHEVSGEGWTYNTIEGDKNERNNYQKQ